MLARMLAASTLLCSLAFLPSAQEKKGADAPDGVFVIDAVHSSVVFKVKHMGVSNFYGRFNDISGKLTLDASDPEAAALDATIEAKSVDTHNADRDKHLKSPDFFNVSEFPTLEFSSKSVSAKGKKVTVTGLLKMHGVEKEVSVEAEQVGYVSNKRGAMVGYEAHFSVKRSDFGMKTSLDSLGDQIDVVVSIEAGKQ